MKLCFSTLGCPAWSWERMVQQAPCMGYDGIEVRGVAGEMHLPNATPFWPENQDHTLVELTQRGLAIACLSASASFHQNVETNLVMARAYIDLAQQLRVPYVRVFGGRITDLAQRDRIVNQVAAALQSLGDYAAGTGVKVLMETHGDFAGSSMMLRVLDRVDSGSVGVLWDVHHPYRLAGETVSYTYDQLADRICHVHVKDSQPSGDGYCYCLPGLGDVPLAEVISLLRSGGYKGWLSFEWEKAWHPNLDEPEVALPAFAHTLRKLLA